MTNVKGNTALKSETTEKTTLTVVKPTETILTPVKDVEEVKEPIATIEPVAEVVKPLTFEEIRDKGKTLFSLGCKYDEVKAKADELKTFKISHNKDIAKIVVSDANGKSFTSGNPKAIAKFIDFCSEQMNLTLSELETEMRKIS